jgi:DNA-3-methyladenine glycosylase I
MLVPPQAEGREVAYSPLPSRERDAGCVRSSFRNTDGRPRSHPLNDRRPPKIRRCAWAESDPLLRVYHDEEWGVPNHDSRRLWEILMLEGFQAGLSWITILRKRDAFRRAFRNFDPARVARFGAADVARLLNDPGIIRSRAKIAATIGGARAYLAMQAAGDDFSQFVWHLAGGRPIQGGGAVPAKTPMSEEFSRILKQRGFKFVGPVIVYAWMQATGIVNDHASYCFRRRVVARLP